MKDLRNWAVVAAAAIAIIGCGGSGGSNSSGGSTSGTGGSQGRGLPTINLSSFGSVQAVFLSGQGRRAPGSLVAVINQFQIQRVNAQDQLERVPALDQQNLPDLHIQLDGYTLNAFEFDVSMNANEPARLYTELPLQIFELDQLDQNNQVTRLTTTTPAFIADPPFDLDLVVFPGRQTTVQIALDDSIVGFDESTGSLTFDRDLFISKNYDVRSNTIKSFISDFIAFDLTGMATADRPKMPNNVPVEMALFSGDGIAVSAGFGHDNTFALLDPIAIQNGIITKGPILGGIRASGSYILQEPDPRDLTQVAKITALQGVWRPFTDVISGVGTSAMIAFPNSDVDIDQNLATENQQQVVLFKLDAAGKVTSMYQGVIRYDAGGTTKPTTGQLSIWPISQVVTADPANQVTGTVSNLVTVPFYAFDSGGNPKLIQYAVKSGDYAITSAVPGNFQFANKGSFVVFRK